jgi:hypothetical protein
MRTRLITAVSFVLPLFAADSALAGKKDKAETFFVRPDSPPDADAKGKLKLETETGKDRDRIEFKAENLDSLGTYSVYMEDALGSGNLVLIGPMELDDDGEPGEFKLRFDEKDEPLPFAVASVTDLVGRQVDIADGSNATVLTATVPDPSAPTGKKGWTKEKVALAQPSVVVDADAKGRVETWYKGKDGRQRFRVKAELLDPLDTYTVRVEDSVGAGSFTNVGDMIIDLDGESGEFKLHLDTQKGDAMPFGVANVDELAGRKVQIVDSAVQVVLEGTLPDLFP